MFQRFSHLEWLFVPETRSYVEKADTLKASPEIFNEQGESPIFDFVSQRDKFLRCCQHKQNIVFQELSGDSHSQLLLMDNCVVWKLKQSFYIRSERNQLSETYLSPVWKFTVSVLRGKEMNKVENHRFLKEYAKGFRKLILYCFLSETHPCLLVVSKDE